MIKIKRIADFENGLQYYSAIHATCEYIVTEDRNDYFFAEIPVTTSREFIETYL